MKFIQKLERIIKRNNSLLCIGLDPDISKFPKHLLGIKDPIYAFNKEIIDNTHDLVSSYKPNIAFYEAYGIDGLSQLKKTIEYLKTTYPEIPTILDAKRADILNTSARYARAIFDDLDFDGVTVNPYLGKDALDPFLAYKNKGVIILCKTSNKGSADFQDLKIDSEPLYVKVARKVIEWNKAYGNCLMVIGATYPLELKKIREIAGDIFFLIPGVGTQGGDLKATIANGLRRDRSGLIINCTRSIIYQSADQNFAAKARKEAQKIKDLINNLRNYECC